MTDSIHNACRSGDLENVKRLLSEDPLLVNADDEHNWRPIFHAGLKRHEDVVRFLIASGADLAAHNGDALHYAGEVPGNKKIVELLIKYGALDAHVRPTNDLARQFFSAIFLGDATRTQSLLRLHPELAQTADGRHEMPIHHAARNGDTAIVRILIDVGADVNAITPRGHTVLYCAGGHGHFEVVQLLLAAGSDPTVKLTRDGINLLQWLAQFPDDRRLTRIAELVEAHLA